MKVTLHSISGRGHFSPKQRDVIPIILILAFYIWVLTLDASLGFLSLICCFSIAGERMLAVPHISSHAPSHRDNVKNAAVKTMPIILSFGLQ